MELDQISRQTINTELKRVSKNTVIYSVGNIGVKSVSFLLIPLYTYYLSTYTVGIIILLELFEVFYNYVAPLGLINAIWRFFNLEQSAGNEKRFISSNFIFILAINAILLVCLIFSSGFISKVYLSDTSFTRLVQVFFIALFLGLSRVYILSLLRIYEKAVQFIILVFIDFVLLIGLTIWFVIGLELGIWGVIYAKLITSSLLFILTIIYLIKTFGVHYFHNDVKRSLQFGFPLIFYGIGFLVLSMSDRLIIKHLISTEAGGIYGISCKFGMILNMVLVTPFVQAWQPILFRLENDPSQKLTYQKIALHFIQIGTVVWVTIAVLSKYLIKLATTEEYYLGIIIVPWIAFAYLLYGLQHIFKAGAIIHNETLKMTGCTVVAAIMNIVLNILMIPKWGIMGAAVSTVLSYLLMLNLILRLSQKKLYINWRWKKMLSVVALGIILVCISFVGLNNVKLNYIKDAIVLVLLPILMISLKLVSFKEVKRLLTNLYGGHL